MAAREETPKSAVSLTAAAAKLGSAGGAKGGPARARKLTPGQRTRIAKMGGEARARRAHQKKGGK